MVKRLTIIVQDLLPKTSQYFLSILASRFGSRERDPGEIVLDLRRLFSSFLFFFLDIFAWTLDLALGLVFSLNLSSLGGLGLGLGFGLRLLFRMNDISRFETSSVSWWGRERFSLGRWGWLASGRQGYFYRDYRLVSRHHLPEED